MRAAAVQAVVTMAARACAHAARGHFFANGVETVELGKRCARAALCSARHAAQAGRASPAREPARRAPPMVVTIPLDETYTQCCHGRVLSAQMRRRRQLCHVCRCSPLCAPHLPQHALLCGRTHAHRPGMCSSALLTGRADRNCMRAPSTSESSSIETALQAALLVCDSGHGADRCHVRTRPGNPTVMRGRAEAAPTPAPPAEQRRPAQACGARQRRLAPAGRASHARPHHGLARAARARARGRPVRSASGHPRPPPRTYSVSVRLPPSIPCARRPLRAAQPRGRTRIPRHALLR